MIFLPLPRPCHRWSHFWGPPTWCDVTYFPILHLEIIKLRVGATSNYAKWTLNVITCILVKLFNGQCSMLFKGIVSIWFIRVISLSYYFWNVMSQNLGSLPPLVTQCHTSSTPSAPLMRDVIYGYTLNHPGYIDEQYKFFIVLNFINTVLE